MNDFGIDPTTHFGPRGDNSLDHGVTTGIVVTKAASEDLWRRRMGHTNSRRVDVLRTMPRNGDKCAGEVDACGTCSVVMSAQQDNPKYVTYDDVLLVYQLVRGDKLRPINRQ